MADRPYSLGTAASSFLPTHLWGVSEPDPGNPGAYLDRTLSGAQVQGSWGLDYLGSTVLAASAHETAVVTIEPRDFLWIYVLISAYGGSPDATGDIGSLRFNGDTGNNYWSRHLYYDAGVWNDVVTASTNLIRLAPTNSRLSRNVFCTINNRANRGKTVNMKNQTGTADAAVVGQVNIAGGEWVNLVDQITSVQMVDAGANNLITGSGFIVLGKNF